MRRLKRFLCLAVCVILILSVVFAVSAGQDRYKICIDGVQIDTADATPYIDNNNRTMVPIRFIAENAGYTVVWSDTEKTTQLCRDGIAAVSVRTGENTLTTLNGILTMDTQAVTKNGRMYVPLRFVSAGLGYAVSYSQSESMGVKTHSIFLAKSSLSVSYIDVGQGDSEFIELPGGKCMLIDAGTSAYGKTVIDYIKGKGYSKIDYLVATHPHADHIGGMTAVVNAFEIGDVYMPKQTTTTKTYENFIDALINKKCTVHNAKCGVVIDDGNYTIKFLSPCNDSYNNLNNCSAVMKLTFGTNSFLFEGDAEKEAEEEILASGADITCDVLKVGHHGSSTASTLLYLKNAKPKYAVISCAEGNTYGHPHSEALNNLEAVGAQIYRTDINGTIVVVSDGTNITLTTSK